MRNGYKMLYIPEHHRADSTGCVYEHIVVAEQKLGRELKNEEVVHHIDENRSNNAPENLMIFANTSEHSAYHITHDAYQKDGVWYAQRKRLPKNCKFCNKLFIPQSEEICYCSHECASKANRKLPDVNQIISILKECNGNMSAVGRVFNVSSNAIVRMLKRNNLPYHSCDYAN